MHLVTTIVASLLAALVISLAGLSVPAVVHHEHPVHKTHEHSYLPSCEGVHFEQVEPAIFELLPFFGWTLEDGVLSPPVCSDQ